MRFRSRDGYDISHGIKIERMHDSTKDELHDERRIETDMFVKSHVQTNIPASFQHYFSSI